MKLLRSLTMGWKIILFLILVLVLAVFIGYWKFYRGLERETEAFFNLAGKKEERVSLKDLEHLPPIMQDYLKQTGILGKCRDCHLTFRQSGRIRSDTTKGWTGFRGTQYMTAHSPGFIWAAQAFPVFIRDKSVNGQGEVSVSFLGLWNLTRQTGTKTDKSALARCLGEYLLYPIGFLNKDIQWEIIDNQSVMARVQVNGVKADGVFFFNEQGLLYRFETKRHRGEQLTDFTGMAEDYKVLDGFFVPSGMRAIWNLPEGDFEYFQCTISNYKVD